MYTSRRGTAKRNRIDQDGPNKTGEEGGNERGKDGKTKMQTRSCGAVRAITVG